jgi:hypothetical protein
MEAEFYWDPLERALSHHISHIKQNPEEEFFCPRSPEENNSAFPKLCIRVSLIRHSNLNS